MIGEVLSAAGGFIVGAGLVASVLLARLRGASTTIADQAARLETAAASVATLAELRAHLGGLRHDIRGILSPALLVADRLVSHEEPGVRRAGDVMVRVVDRAVARLSETTDQGAANSAQL